ncbi:MAG: hypothetical protein WCF20_13325 [Methylovirgula sp.]
MNEILSVRLREIVGIHNVMFQRLLFEQPVMAVLLAELFRDVGETYLEISESLRKDEKEYLED